MCKKASTVPDGKIENLPRNLGLEAALHHIKRIQAARAVSMPGEICEKHNMILNLVCMEHRELCCLECADQGEHSGHFI